ncbi:MAG: hypothetical protein ACWGQW_06510, partial [bacterium]
MSITDSQSGKRGLPKWSRSLTLEHLWLALPVVIVIVMGFRHKLRLLDFWWHLKIGEIIIDTVSIPRNDMFSFTIEGKTFVLQNWLTEALYSLIYRIGGLELLIVTNTLVLVGSLLAIYHLCWDPLKRVRPAVLACGFAVLALAGVYSNVRPQTVSFLFFAVFYWILLRYSHGQRCFPWLLPLLMALWVNLHGAFVLGLGLIALFLVLETVRRLSIGKRSDTLSLRELKTLLFIFLVTLAATLVNPEMYGVYDYVLTVLRDPGSQVYVSEWQPPNIKSFSGIVCFYGPCLLSLLIILYSGKRLNLTELALYFGFAAFALTALRNGIWFSLIVAPIVAGALAVFGRNEKNRSTLVSRFWATEAATGTTPRDRTSTLNTAVALAMLFGCIISTPWLQPTITGSPLWEPDTPVGVFDYIEAEKLKGNIYHPQSYGDYLIW